MNIIGRVSNQQLSVIGQRIVGDSVDYLTAGFHFVTEDWEGLSRIMAHFSSGDDLYEIALDENGGIPADRHLNLTEGIWKIWLHGELREGSTLLKRITTNVCELTVEASGGFGGEPFGPYPATELESFRELIEGAQGKRITDTGDRFLSDTVEGALEELADRSEALQPKEITDAGGYYTTGTVESALQEIGAKLAQHRPEYTITKTAQSTVTLEENDTTVITAVPTAIAVTLPEPTEGEDYLTGLIFEAGAEMTFADTAPIGYAVKWDSDPTWTAGKVYEIIYRCLWVEDSNTDVIISAKWSEV